MGGKYKWLVLVGVVAALHAMAAVAEAQTVVPIGGQARSFDRIRASALYWRGNLNGKLGLGEIEEIPRFLDVENELGISGSSGGYILEAHIGAGKRHRFLVATSKLEHSGDNVLHIDETIGGVPVDVQIPLQSVINMREFRFNYSLLFVARPEAEIGLLAGVGWFEAFAAIDTPIGDASVKLSTPYPNFGGQVMINPVGRVRFYAALTGFPRVNVEEFEGWLADFQIRGEVFLIENVGVTVGYRSYHMDFRLDVDDPNFDLKWDGFFFGAQVRY